MSHEPQQPQPYDFMPSSLSFASYIPSTSYNHEHELRHEQIRAEQRERREQREQREQKAEWLLSFGRRFFFEEEKNIPDDVCCICLEPFDTNTNTCELTCKHIFHTKCIINMVETTRCTTRCPLCRKDILM